MRTDLDHLPAAKQRELEEVVRILFAEFREATENATGRKKSARILKIILFGSYARATGSMHRSTPTSINPTWIFWSS
ncbi:hypothetical protein [Sphingobium yanoikuyae]|jgi:uncharacterized protein|uniref:hypothetical protein n=1 Tax=Sphingobium yanoikuyae TaxID=13690 RepID=UPI0030B8F21E